VSVACRLSSSSFALGNLADARSFRTRLFLFPELFFFFTELFFAAAARLGAAFFFFFTASLLTTLLRPLPVFLEELGFDAPRRREVKRL